MNKSGQMPDRILDRYKALHKGWGLYLRHGEVMVPGPELWDGNCFVRKLSRLLKFVAVGKESFSVLDYGCGKANYAPKLHDFYSGRIKQWYLYDPGYEPYEKPPTGKFDYIVCADVMEHVEDAEMTLEQMAPFLHHHGIALFSISGYPDSRTFEDGLNMHVTLKSFEEWQVLLKKHFKNKRVILLYNNTQYWESWHASV